MRRVLLLGIIAAAAASFASPVTAQKGAMDCANYPSQEVAQSVYLDADHNARKPLDADNNGQACDEGSTGGSTFASNVLPQVADDKDCSDFATPEAAQTFFEQAGPGDPHQLDPDGDGVACESLASPAPGASVAPSATTAPVATAAPTTGPLPNNGSPAAVMGFTGFSLLSVGVGFTRLHRKLSARIVASYRARQAKVKQMQVFSAVVHRSQR
jgi:hypothetical protein